MRQGVMMAGVSLGAAQTSPSGSGSSSGNGEEKEGFSRTDARRRNLGTVRSEFRETDGWGSP